MDNKQLPEPDKGQMAYGQVVHWVTIVSCLIVLVAPVLILLFPQRNILNPNLVFGAIFEGKRSAEIWAAAGLPFKIGEFWPLFFGNIFTPDGFAMLGVVLGCSVTAWALLPAIGIYLKKKDYFYACVMGFIFALIFLAMSGLINMAG